MDGALKTIGEMGPAGALLVVALFAIWWLATKLLAEKDVSREDRAELIKALMESAQAKKDVAKALVDNTEVMRRMLEGFK